MKTIDVSPAEWLRDLLASHPDVKSVDYGTDAERSHLVVHTVGGRRLGIRVGDCGIYMGPYQ